jgi:geranylgeranyl diphosphate synthase type II
MQHIKQILKEGIEKFIQSNNGNPKELYEPINYSLSLGGKRLRPFLLMQACEVFGGDINVALPSALGIEVFHNFTLLHDDIMDNAPLRRNMPTVHEKWSNSIAILSGDTMFVKSYQLILQTKHERVIELLELFSKTAIEVCEGQQLDMNFETSDNVRIDDYLKMIELKTAVLVATALKMGSIIANANKLDSNYIYDFGLNIGIAFQLQDDILDVYGNMENFGKMVGGDIACNKKTYLLLKSKELANDLQKIEIDKWLNYKGSDLNAKINAVKEIYNDLKIREEAEKIMLYYFEKAIVALDKTGLIVEKKNMLKLFADELMVRSN